MNTIRHLSQRLSAFRKQFDLTQEQFAELTGFDYKFYQAIESGRKKQIWLETVERLAAAYGLQAWELLAPTEPECIKQPKRVRIRIKADNPMPPRKVGRPPKTTSKKAKD